MMVGVHSSLNQKDHEEKGEKKDFIIKSMLRRQREKDIEVSLS